LLKPFQTCASTWETRFPALTQALRGRALHAFLREQEALAAAAPPPADQAASTPQSATCPPFHEEPVREQPAAAESRAAAEPAEGRAGAVDALSRHLWAAVNPGYCPAGGEKRLSVQRADYTWDAAEVRSPRGVTLAGLHRLANFKHLLAASRYSLSPANTQYPALVA